MQLQVNTVGTQNLLDTFKDSLAGKRVLLTSTSAAIDRDSFPRSPLNEDSPPRPRTAYGRTKLKAEAIVRRKIARIRFRLHDFAPHDALWPRYAGRAVLCPGGVGQPRPILG